eukprot:4271922-Prymnesium_polylepis.1
MPRTVSGPSARPEAWQKCAARASCESPCQGSTAARGQAFELRARHLVCNASLVSRVLALAVGLVSLPTSAIIAHMPLGANVVAEKSLG